MKHELSLDQSDGSLCFALYLICGYERVLLCSRLFMHFGRAEVRYASIGLN